MKVGIITFHRAQNHGAVLQCYALQTVLQRMGHDVEVVDYRCKEIEKEYKLIDTRNLRSAISSFIHIRGRIRNKKNFREFRKSLNVSKRTYRKPQDFDVYYDYLVLGSDQIWNPNLTGGFDSVYFGKVGGKTRAISYAASMGSYVPKEKIEKEIIKDNVDNLHAVGVREEDQKQILASITDKTIEHVLDPTLLLMKEQYAPLIKSRMDCKKKYLFYYQLISDKRALTAVENLAKKRNLELIVFFGDKPSFGTYLSQSDITVSNFITYIKCAEIVCTSSFHGLTFSIINNKEFYYMGNGLTNRAVSLLHLLGLESRNIVPGMTIKDSSIDYNLVNEHLGEYRSISLSFLTDNL